MAYTSKFAARAGIEDRVLSSYAPPVEIAPTWRRAVTIVVPTMFLRAPYPERASSDSRPISWWSAPDDRHSIWFEVLVSDTKPDENVAFDCIGEVGRFSLPGGGLVWILANEVSDAGKEGEWAEMGKSIRLAHAASGLEAEYPTGMAWGFDNGDGHPMIWDAGDLSAELS